MTWVGPVVKNTQTNPGIPNTTISKSGEPRENTMATVLAVYKNGKCVGRCDGRCHNAAGDRCHWVCGGLMHGQGEEKAAALAAVRGPEILAAYPRSGPTHAQLPLPLETKTPPEEKKKVSLSQTDVQQITKLSLFTAKKSSVEVLSYLLLHADGHVSAQACNLTVSAKLALAGQVEREGSVLIPAGLLDVLKHEETVQVSAGPKMLTVKAGKTQMRRQHQHDVEDFPQSAAGSEVTPAGSVRSDELNRAIQHIAGIPEQNESRPWARTIWLQIEGHTMTLGASDGMQLAIRQLPMESEPPRNLETLVSPQVAKLAAFLNKHLDEENTSIELAVSPTALLLSTPTVETQIAIVEGAIPDYHRIVPSKDGATCATISTGLLRNAIKAVLPFSYISNVAITTGTLTVATERNEVGFARVTNDATTSPAWRAASCSSRWRPTKPRSTPSHPARARPS